MNLCSENSLSEWNFAQTILSVITLLCSYFMAAPQPTADLANPSAAEDPAPVGFHKCSGGEASLLDCERAAVEGESRPVGVTCLAAGDLSERCAAGELPFADTCYYVGTESQTRLKAELKCRQRGATLVVVNSQVRYGILSLPAAAHFPTNPRREHILVAYDELQMNLTRICLKVSNTMAV